LGNNESKPSQIQRLYAAGGRDEEKTVPLVVEAEDPVITNYDSQSTAKRVRTSAFASRQFGLLVGILLLLIAVLRHSVQFRRGGEEGTASPPQEQEDQALVEENEKEPILYSHLRHDLTGPLSRT